MCRLTALGRAMSGGLDAGPLHDPGAAAGQLRKKNGPPCAKRAIPGSRRLGFLCSLRLPPNAESADAHCILPARGGKLEKFVRPAALAKTVRPAQPSLGSFERGKRISLGRWSRGCIPADHSNERRSAEVQLTDFENR